MLDQVGYRLTHLFGCLRGVMKCWNDEKCTVWLQAATNFSFISSPFFPHFLCLLSSTFHGALFLPSLPCLLFLFFSSVFTSSLLCCFSVPLIFHLLLFHPVPRFHLLVFYGPSTIAIFQNISPVLSSFLISPLLSSTWPLLAFYVISPLSTSICFLWLATPSHSMSCLPSNCVSSCRKPSFLFLGRLAYNLWCLPSKLSS